MKTLILPSTYEGIKEHLVASGTPYAAKLVEFVRPVEESERELAQMTAQLMGGSGRAVLLHGAPGTGKSTFIESLTWRTHVGVSDLRQVNCAELPQENVLSEVMRRLQKLAEDIKGLQRLTAVVLNYLEDLEGQPEEQTRAFFRALNGLLRNNRMFVIWPVTDLDDARRMLDYASAVSGTVFFPGKEILEFRGPPPSSFPAIVKSTIAVLNDGQTLEEFGLTEAELHHTAKEMAVNPGLTLRAYLDRVVTQWREQSGYLEELRAKIPKPTEVWTVFAYPDAESVVGQFSRRSEHLDEVWTALHSKLWEYIPKSQRASDWTPMRLQLAIAGVLRTRILFMPTNVIVSSFMAHAPVRAESLKLSEKGVPQRWSEQAAAQGHVMSSPVYRLLTGKRSPPGKRKSGPAAKAAESAERAFEELSRYASGGNDRHLNRALAEALKHALPTGYTVACEVVHPWIPNITPDIRVDLPDGRHICIELAYTSQREPYVLADYTLKKLDRYMKQLEYYVDRARRYGKQGDLWQEA